MTAHGTPTKAERLRSRLRFLPLAPALVGVVSVAVAVFIGLLGLSNLTQRTSVAASQRAAVLVRTIADRVAATSALDRPELIERAARRSGAELLLVRGDGRLVVGTLVEDLTRREILQLLITKHGDLETALGPTRFAVAPLANQVQPILLVAFVPMPDTPAGTGSLLTSIGALAALLTGVAALVAFTLARDVHSDVAYVRRRITAIARAETALRPRPIPVRSVDQVGVLTDAFNVLAERFIAAEHAYRQDLDAAKRYDRDRSAFLAALSHELRTPLNAILGFTEILLSEVDGPLTEEAHENLTIVQRSGEHLRALIDDILDLSALESGELTLQRELTDVFQIAREVVREARVVAKNKAIELELEGDEVFAAADPRRLRQMIGNVVWNAVKFTQVGSVRVRVTEYNGEAVIRVADTGPGIPLSEQGAIFEEYRQSGDRKTRRGGTGLGLAITQRLAKMHGGRVELNSQVGEGSVFTMFIPVTPPVVEDSLMRIPIPTESPT